jgi:VWFA-related protein
MVNSNRKSRIGNRQSVRQLSIANVAMHLAAVLVVAAPLSAQQPTFRTGTTLIEFTLVALDSEGRPVTDLTKDDVVLTEGGQTRDIAFFRFDGDAPAVSRVRRPELLPGFVTNKPEPERNVVAIVLDLINIALVEEFHGQTMVRGLILRYLESLPPNTRAGLFRFSELQPITALQTFTDRIDLLRAKVKSLSPAVRIERGSSLSRGGGRVGTGNVRSAMTEAESRGVSAINTGILESRRAKTLANLEALGNHLAGIPGRKSLIWISDGLPLQTNDKRADGSFETLISHSTEFRQMAQRLANQGISVYPVHAVGLPPYRRGDNAELATFGVFADVTGGRVVKDTNDLVLGLTLAATDQRGTYTVGFYASDEPDDEWRQLTAEVKRRDVTVRHRQGYLAVRRAQPQNWPAKSWNELAYQPLDATGIHMNGRTIVADGQATVSLQIAARDLYFHAKDGQLIADLEIGLVEKAQKRKTTEPTNVRVQPMEISINDSAAGERAGLIPMNTTWPMNPGTSAVRVIVRDRFTGKYGTLEMKISR